MKQDGINIIISLLKGKSKKDVDDMDDKGMFAPQTNDTIVTGTKGNIKSKDVVSSDTMVAGKYPKREGKIIPPRKSYKDDYEEMGDSGLQMRKRSGGKRFTLGE